MNNSDSINSDISHDHESEAGGLVYRSWVGSVRGDIVANTQQTRTMLTQGDLAMYADSSSSV